MQDKCHDTLSWGICRAQSFWQDPLSPASLHIPSLPPAFMPFTHPLSCMCYTACTSATWAVHPCQGRVCRWWQLQQQHSQVNMPPCATKERARGWLVGGVTSRWQNVHRQVRYVCGAGRVCESRSPCGGLEEKGCPSTLCPGHIKTWNQSQGWMISLRY